MQNGKHWVGTWAAAPAPAEGVVGFNNHTLRMMPRISLGGDTLRVRTSGGGGSGNPLTRDPALVLRDIRLDKISPAHAESAYGVVVRGGEVDVEATRGLRAGMQHEGNT